MTVKKQRPVNLELNTISFPASAIASILHRISGVIMFVAMGILMWAFATSLSSAEGFEAVKECLDTFIAKFVIWGTLTALAYHMLGGFRHLLMDCGLFEELKSGNTSAKVTMALTVVLSVLVAVQLW
ncbi:succinate dehydrogenase cytochrome b556 subunit [Marinifaba aquimaris]|uniref:succinate dehydrogenase cytochrome b556 subunit n=1 Tax=Marinifaba aquimaris TaxID=2741323 RepID=UPI001C2CD5B6|nr:succinate dehydrogenase cytochrome b556 subunit [Marinifaba aquimaris]